MFVVSPACDDNRTYYIKPFISRRAGDATYVITPVLSTSTVLLYLSSRVIAIRPQFSYLIMFLEAEIAYTVKIPYFAVTYQWSKINMLHESGFLFSPNIIEEDKLTWARKCMINTLGGSMVLLRYKEIAATSVYLSNTKEQVGIQDFLLGNINYTIKLFASMYEILA